MQTSKEGRQKKHARWENKWRLSVRVLLLKVFLKTEKKRKWEGEKNVLNYA